MPIKGVGVCRLHLRLALRFDGPTPTIRLLPANKNCQPIEVQAQQSFEIWGVVSNVIHAL